MRAVLVPPVMALAARGAAVEARTHRECGTMCAVKAIVAL